jgi:imidazolonepropionase-like amidohydrolase
MTLSSLRAFILPAIFPLLTLFTGHVRAQTQARTQIYVRTQLQARAQTYVRAKTQTYIVHAQLVDVETQTIRPDYTVVLSNDTITSVGPSSTLRPPAGATIIDATGKWLMPGLVDAHVHFFQTGGLYTRPDAIDLRKNYPYEKELTWYKEHMKDQLKRYLACGITTVIDDGATLALLTQRDTFADKYYAPRILMAGPLLSTGYVPTPFDELQDPDQPFYPVNTPAEAVAMTAKQYPFRPDIIKIWYIVSDANTTQDADSKFPMVKAVIAEAHAHHYRVAVHATQQRAAQLAVTAGADFLVHEIDDEVIADSLLRQLKARRVVVCPTLTVTAGYSATFSQQQNPTPPERNTSQETNSTPQQYKPTAEDIAIGDPEQLASLMEFPYLPDSALTHRYRLLAKEKAPGEALQDSIRSLNLRKMQAAGVIIATGTDAGNIGTLHASSYYTELHAMQQAGLSNWNILVASTLNGAKALGKEQVFGSIHRGKTADLLLLDANPVADLSNLEKIHLVLRRGIALSPDTLIPATPTDIVQRQVNAYNAHDLEAFLRFYADTATLYDLHGKVLARGLAEMRKEYSFLNNTPGLHVTITNRTVMNNKVIDHELATKDGRRVGEGVAIYFVTGSKIGKVVFVEGTDQ